MVEGVFDYPASGVHVIGSMVANWEVRGAEHLRCRRPPWRRFDATRPCCLVKTALKPANIVFDKKTFHEQKFQAPWQSLDTFRRRHSGFCAFDTGHSFEFISLSGFYPANFSCTMRLLVLTGWKFVIAILILTSSYSDSVSFQIIQIQCRIKLLSGAALLVGYELRRFENSLKGPPGTSLGR